MVSCAQALFRTFNSLALLICAQMFLGNVLKLALETIHLGMASMQHIAGAQGRQVESVQASTSTSVDLRFFPTPSIHRILYVSYIYIYMYFLEFRRGTSITRFVRFSGGSSGPCLGFSRYYTWLFQSCDANIEFEPKPGSPEVAVLEYPRAKPLVLAPRTEHFLKAGMAFHPDYQFWVLRSGKGKYGIFLYLTGTDVIWCYLVSCAHGVFSHFQ